MSWAHAAPDDVEFAEWVSGSVAAQLATGA